MNLLCLYFIAGAAYFTSEEEQISVNDDGTVKFNLSLSFSKPGPSGLLQRIDRFELIKNARTIALCVTNNPPCTFSANFNQWWTVEDENRTVTENRYDLQYILHQVRSDDRGLYTAQVEGFDPASSSQDAFQKDLQVTGEACKNSMQVTCIYVYALCIYLLQGLTV